MRTDEAATITVEQLKRSRSANLCNFTEWETRLIPILATPTQNLTLMDVSPITAFEPKLHTLSDKLMDLCEQIRSATIAEDEVDAEQEKSDELEGRVTTFLYSIQTCLRAKEQHDALQLASPRVSVTSTAPPTSSNSTGIRLPKLDVPKFSGKYTSWRTFIELFRSSVGNNASLPAVQKLQYLKSFLEGEPLKLIAQLHITESNYQVAVDLLMERYDNERMIVKSYVAAIFAIQPVKPDTPSQLRKLVNVFLENTMALKALGQETDSCDYLWIHILTEKLDQDSRREWELKSPGREVQKLKNLLDFLDQRCQALEASPSQSSRKPVVENSKSQSYSGSAPSNCPNCDQQHRIHTCDKFLALDL